ncbi:hypothetical protein RSAG8_04094, partial [Rhizoctonia solani AG-8 WAC10335]
MRRCLAMDCWKHYLPICYRGYWSLFKVWLFKVGYMRKGGYRLMCD